MEAKKILIVDDDKDLVKLLSQKISQAGYRIIVAYDGLQATRLAYKEDPDLIILDIKLPAGGGIGTLKNLKSSAKTNTKPVIVITAFEDPEIRKEVSEYGVEEYMVKPINSAELIEKIWKYT